MLLLKGFQEVQAMLPHQHIPHVYKIQNQHSAAAMCCCAARYKSLLELARGGHPIKNKRRKQQEKEQMIEWLDGLAWARGVKSSP
jgi:hypothetical protein